MTDTENIRNKGEAGKSDGGSRKADGGDSGCFGGKKGSRMRELIRRGTDWFSSHPSLSFKANHKFGTQRHTFCFSHTHTRTDTFMGVHM